MCSNASLQVNAGRRNNEFTLSTETRNVNCVAFLNVQIQLKQPGSTSWINTIVHSRLRRLGPIHGPPYQGRKAKHHRLYRISTLNCKLTANPLILSSKPPPRHPARRNPTCSQRPRWLHMDRYLGSGRGYSLEFEFIHEATILTSVRHSLMFNTPLPFPIYLPFSTTPSTRVRTFEKVQSDGLHVLMTAKCLSPTISNTFLPSRIRIYQQYYAYRTP